MIAMDQTLITISLNLFLSINICYSFLNPLINPQNQDLAWLDVVFLKQQNEAFVPVLQQPPEAKLRLEGKIVKVIPHWIRDMLYFITLKMIMCTVNGRLIRKPFLSHLDASGSDNIKADLSLCSVTRSIGNRIAKIPKSVSRGFKLSQLLSFCPPTTYLSNPNSFITLSLMHLHFSWDPRAK